MATPQSGLGKAESVKGSDSGDSAATIAVIPEETCNPALSCVVCGKLIDADEGSDPG